MCCSEQLAVELCCEIVSCAKLVFSKYVAEQKAVKLWRREAVEHRRRADRQGRSEQQNSYGVVEPYCLHRRCGWGAMSSEAEL